MDLRIGTSGWTYPHWRHDAFYPTGLRQRDELGHLAKRLHTVEINGSFYSLQRPSSYRKWRDLTPEGFTFAVKGSQFITHRKKLRDVELPLATFLASGMLDLGEKLGQVLWQLPPQLPFDAHRTSGFFTLLPRTHGAAAEAAQRCDRTRFERWDQEPAVITARPDHPLRHAIEVRHPSYQDENFLQLCRDHDVAIVLADTAGRFPWIDRPAGTHGYVRLHGSRKLYASGYTAEELDVWTARLRGWCEVEGLEEIAIYFDNDGSAHAPHDALALAGRLF